MYVHKNKRLLSMSFKDRQCFDVTQYGTYSSVLLCVFQYMQQIHEKNKQKPPGCLFHSLLHFKAE